VRYLLALFAVSGCSKDPIPAPIADVRPANSAPVADARPPLPTLPPFGKTAMSDPAKAMELGHHGLRASVLGDGDGLADATAAVLADPGSAYARYAVACAAKDEAFALAQLRLLVDASCDDCTDTVQNVLIDTECPWTAAHKALAATTHPSTQRAAVAAIVGALASPDRSGAKRYFSGHATSVFECSNCSDNTHDRRADGSGAHVLADIVKELAADDKYGVPLVTGDRLLRTDDCFSVDRLVLHHSHTFFDKLCFAHGTTTVSSIVFIGG
jgi:hypothetical protein